ncbi:hypothetical protein BDK51DRAFT_31776, partial [Blyttiomyces helicus]
MSFSSSTDDSKRIKTETTDINDLTEDEAFARRLQDEENQLASLDSPGFPSARRTHLTVDEMLARDLQHQFDFEDLQQIANKRKRQEEEDERIAWELSAAEEAAIPTLPTTWEPILSRPPHGESDSRYPNIGPSTRIFTQGPTQSVTVTNVFNQ